MSKFTDFLNLFKWEPDIDAEEEIDIDKALNENWDKLDTKLKTYMEDMDSDINDFKQDVEDEVASFKDTTTQEISTFESNVNERVQDLQDSISSTQSFHNYSLEIDADTTAGQEITIPCYYKVGEEVLDVYLNGERLLKSTDDVGTDGHYLEVGDIGSISNKIKTTTDWSLATGDVLELVVRGEYNDTV